MKGVAAFALGAAAMAIITGAALFGCEPCRAVAPGRLIYASAASRPGEPPKCRGGDRFGDLVRTPAQAELVFRSLFPDRQFVRTRVRVSDDGDFWHVEQAPPKGWKGGGPIARISKCDAAVTVVALAQ